MSGKLFFSQWFFVFFLIILSLTNLTLADTDEDDGEDSGEPTAVILFMFFGLGLGIIVMQIISYFGEFIPYTCVVFILGVIFSSANKHTGVFGESIAQWDSIDAEIVLFVFLPPLIFGEAMNLNWYHVQGGIAQAAILAGPGVIFGAISMGIITKFLLPYNWNWNLAMTFGAVLSATDPVAVVALLKAACASPKLTILIVGESLLNDGTAMVLFTIFFNSLNGQQYSVGQIIAYVLSAGIGSVLLGGAFGLVTVRWLRSANRPLKETDVTIQTAITITCAYLCFFTAQYTLQISGVLACCGAGIVLAWLAPPIILSQETMHNVWDMIEWVLNTLIFLLTGLIIGHRVLAQVDAIDWLYCIVLYFVLMGLRFVTITLLFPWISTIGHKCTRNEAIFMSCSGLRGALSMTLALIVEKSGPTDLDKETSRLFFYVGGIAALSLIINATTANWLLVYLGLVGGDTAEKVLVMNQIKKKLRKKMDKVIREMAKEFSFTPDEMEEVRMSCTLLNEVNMDALYRDTDVIGPRVENMLHDPINTINLVDLFEMKLKTLVDKLHTGRDSIMLPSRPNNNINEDGDADEVIRAVNRPAPLRRGSAREFRDKQHGESFSSTADGRARSKSVGGRRRSESMSAKKAHSIARMLSMSSRGSNAILIQELLQYVRAIFLEIVRVKYWHNIEGGKLPRLSHSAQFLLYSIEVGIDEVGFLTGARDWACIEEELEYTPRIVTILNFFEDYLPTWLSKYTSLIVGKIEARNEKRAVYMLTSFIEAHEHAQRKIHGFIDEEGEDLGLGEEAIIKTPEEIRVVAESVEAVRKAKLQLDAMSGDTIHAIRSKQTARLVLAKEAEMIKTMLEEGLISTVHAEEFLEEISVDTARIEKERNRMYREQAKQKGKQRQAMKQEETEMRRSSQAEMRRSSQTTAENNTRGSDGNMIPFRRSESWTPFNSPVKSPIRGEKKQMVLEEKVEIPKEKVENKDEKVEIPVKADKIEKSEPKVKSSVADEPVETEVGKAPTATDKDKTKKDKKGKKTQVKSDFSEKTPTETGNSSISDSSAVDGMTAAPASVTEIKTKHEKSPQQKQQEQELTSRDETKSDDISAVTDNDTVQS